MYNTVQTHYEVDSYAYEAQAYTLFSESRPQGVPLEPPGYSMFIAAVYRLLPTRPASIVFVQVLLAVALLACVGWATHNLFNISTASIALLFLSINLNLLLFCQYLLIDVLFCFLVTAFFGLTIRALQLHSHKMFLAAFTIIGLSLWIRPALLWFIPVYSIFLWCMSISKRTIGVGVILCISSLVGLLIYHWNIYGVITIGNVSTINLFSLYVPRLCATAGITEYPHTLIDVIRASLSHPLATTQVLVTQWIKTLFAPATTQLHVAVHPYLTGGTHSFASYGGTLVNRASHYLLGPTPTPVLSFICIVEALWTWVRWLFITVGLVTMYRHTQYAALTFTILITGYLVFVTGPEGCGRLRLMIEPILVILSAYGIHRTYVAILQHRSKKEVHG